MYSTLMIKANQQEFTLSVWMLLLHIQRIKK